jgi:hypothetical protein
MWAGKCYASPPFRDHHRRVGELEVSPCKRHRRNVTISQHQLQELCWEPLGHGVRQIGVVIRLIGVWQSVTLGYGPRAKRTDIDAKMRNDCLYRHLSILVVGGRRKGGHRTLGKSGCAVNLSLSLTFAAPTHYTHLCICCHLLSQRHSNW